MLRNPPLYRISELIICACMAATSTWADTVSDLLLIKGSMPWPNYSSYYVAFTHSSNKMTSSQKPGAFFGIFVINLILRWLLQITEQGFELATLKVDGESFDHCNITTLSILSDFKN